MVVLERKAKELLALHVCVRTIPFQTRVVYIEVSFQARSLSKEMTLKVMTHGLTKRYAQGKEVY